MWHFNESASIERWSLCLTFRVAKPRAIKESESGLHDNDKRPARYDVFFLIHLCSVYLCDCSCVAAWCSFWHSICNLCPVCSRLLFKWSLAWKQGVLTCHVTNALPFNKWLLTLIVIFFFSEEYCSTNSRNQQERQSEPKTTTVFICMVLSLNSLFGPWWLLFSGHVAGPV